MHFRVGPYSLALSAVYAAGHTLTLAEATALNEARLRRVRSKCEALLQKLQRQGAEDHEGALRAALRDWDLYRFEDLLEGVQQRSQRSSQAEGPLRGTIEWELWEVAKEELEGQIATLVADGAGLPTVAQRDDLLQQLLKLPKLRERARERYRLRSKIQKDVLLDLLGGLS